MHIFHPIEDLATDSEVRQYPNGTVTLQCANTDLQQQAQDCQSRIRQLAATMEQTAKIWQGEDCQTFLSQARSLQPHLIRLTEIMSQYGDTLIRTAQTYRQLQQDRAAQAARLL